jgi:phospholipid-binding lipoprotein MlaA
LRNLIVFLLIHALLMCWVPPGTAADSSAPRSGEISQQDPKTAHPESGKTPSGGKDIEAEYLDDKLDFLEDDEDDEDDIVEVSDPIAGWNRAMFHFNDKLYFWALKPVAKGYRVIVPTTLRVCVSNFFNNAAAPVRVINTALQGKWGAAGSELMRFFINTTAGLGGIGDPAQATVWKHTSDEDMGQTLAVYGIGAGMYIVWPFLGASTLRDSVGKFGDLFLHPLFFVDELGVSIALKAIDTVNQTSFRIGDYEALKDAALDPYAAMRSAYIQYREKKINE